MKINRPFNNMNLKEYKFYIDNYKSYTDFNTLGLYRSLTENEKLSVAEKIELRDYAHKTFHKTFDFLQIKDPVTFFLVSTLGLDLTEADKAQLWLEIKNNQQEILKDKKISHRNFGDYSKHNCGNEDCPCNGIMIKQGSVLAEGHINFITDKNRFNAKEKSKRLKKESKNWKKDFLVDDEKDF